jgi:nucleotide-binding universal stress UspA family protein
MIEDTPDQYKVRMQKHAEKTLDAVAQAAQAAGVACETVQVEHEHPYRAIIDTAESKDCDLIVMASHGRHGMSAIVLGSETVKSPPMSCLMKSPSGSSRSRTKTS